MNRLIAVVGNSGSGKTTLVQRLCQTAGFTPALEQHGERPFQALFANSKQRFALANQVDYLLYRAEQEQALRQASTTGLVDGGLDLDFHAFTQLFRRRAYLNEDEHALCERLYATLRALLPGPDLFIYLDAPLPVVARRYAQRGRPLEIAELDDLVLLDELVTRWTRTIDPARLLIVNAADDDFCVDQQIRHLVTKVNGMLFTGPCERNVNA